MIFNARNRRRSLLLGCLAATYLSTVALAQDEAEAAAASDLPEASELLEKAVEAMGGAKAFEGIKSTETHMSMDIAAAGMTMTMEMFSGEDGRFLVRQSTPMGEVGMGSDGKIAWMNNPMTGGYELLDEEQTAQSREQAGMHNMVNSIAANFEKIETVGKETFGEREAYRVSLVEKAPEGDEEPAAPEQFAIFDAENGLLLGMIQATPMGEVAMRFEDWKEVGPIKMFHKMVVDQMGMQIIMTVDSIEFNKVDPTVFELPDKVKELAADKEADASDDG